MLDQGSETSQHQQQLSLARIAQGLQGSRAERTQLIRGKVRNYFDMLTVLGPKDEVGMGRNIGSTSSKAYV